MLLQTHLVGTHAERSHADIQLVTAECSLAFGLLSTVSLNSALDVASKCHHSVLCLLARVFIHTYNKLVACLGLLQGANSQVVVVDAYE